MKIRTVEHVATVSRPGSTFPDDLPHIAVAGRSNVGKSSLLNRLLGRRHLAPVSSTPGKTRAIELYRVNSRFYLVDLPGYGFAKLPAPVRGRWKPLIEGYFERARALTGVIQIVDARHPPTEDDLTMTDYLASRTVPTLFVLTKTDKLSAADRARRVPDSVRRLRARPQQCFLFSAKTGEGRIALLKSVADLLRRGEAEETR